MGEKLEEVLESIKDNLLYVSIRIGTCLDFVLVPSSFIRNYCRLEPSKQTKSNLYWAIGGEIARLGAYGTLSYCLFFKDIIAEYNQRPNFEFLDKK